MITTANQYVQNKQFVLCFVTYSLLWINSAVSSQLHDSWLKECLLTYQEAACEKSWQRKEEKSKLSS